MNESRQLLTDYTRNGSETAFRELVARYINLVYSTAVRLVDGDTHLAEDVVQTVFIHLAQKARRLSPEVLIGGWLHQATCNVAATAMRSQHRRQIRERVSAEMNAINAQADLNLARLTPVLDEAIEQLGTEDRAAILLRFFEQREFGVLGRTLGVSEEAARKRVGRALEKLQALLKRRGVTLSVAALGAVLGTEAATAAPAGLAASIAAAALIGATGGGTALTLIKILTMTKLKMGAIGAIVVAAVTTPLVMQYQAQARLQQENQTLRRQLEQFSPLIAENERLSNALTQSSSPQQMSNAEGQELSRLRGEVRRLRASVQELEQLKQSKVVQNALKRKDREAKLRELLQQMPNRTIPEFYLLGSRGISDIAGDADLESEEGVGKAFFQLRFRAMNLFAAKLQPALKKYVDANNGQPPQDALQLASYFDPPIDSAVLQRYTVLPFDTNQVMGGWSGGWVVTQKQPVEKADSRWFISPVGFSPGQFDSGDSSISTRLVNAQPADPSPEQPGIGSQP